MAASKAWNVYLRGVHIDTVDFISEMGEDEVKRALVGADGFDPGIHVEEHRNSDDICTDLDMFQLMLKSIDPNSLDLVADENEIYSPFGTSNS